MRLLVLGGTAFLGRAVARQARLTGHEVTCAARGVSGPPPDGVTFVALDRSQDGLAALDGLEFDAVVDVASRPSQVRRAVAALAPRVEHAVYVSTGSVYADRTTPHQRVTDAPVLPAAPATVDDPAGNGFADYGPCKVACEEAVRAGFGEHRSFICRAGLIIGPEDELGRFTYWVERLVRGGEVLAPGEPTDLVQYIDVRDLAGWLVLAAETRLAGTYDGVGGPVTRQHFLSRVAAGVAATAELTWVPQGFLLDHGVRPWQGPGALPLWLPLPDFAGFMSRDAGPSLDAGLGTRDLADTARDTLAWLRSGAAAAGVDPAGLPDGEPPGLSPQREVEVLAAWHAHRGRPDRVAAASGGPG